MGDSSNNTLHHLSSHGGFTFPNSFLGVDPPVCRGDALLSNIMPHGSTGNSSSRNSLSLPQISSHSCEESASEQLSSSCSPEEGYDLDFLYPPGVDHNKYECPVCLHILREPYQTECGHRFCQYCINKWLKEQGGVGRCPVDNSTIEQTMLFPDNYAKREIQSLQVRCPNTNEGCSSTPTLKELKHHLSVCEYACVPCPNQCSSILLRKDLHKHISDECQMRVLLCHICSSSVKANEFENHVLLCPLTSTTCKLCERKMQQGKLRKHLENDCPKTVVACNFQKIGCHFKAERQFMPGHLESSTQSHLQLMLEKMLLLDKNELGGEEMTRQKQMDSLVGTETQDQTQRYYGALSSGHFPENRLSMGLSMGGGDTNTTWPLSGTVKRTNDRGDRVVRSLEWVSPTRRSQSCSSDPNLASCHNLDYFRTATMMTEEIPPVVFESVVHSGADLEGGMSLDALYRLQNLQSFASENAIQNESLARHDNILEELRLKNESLEKSNRELRSKVKTLEQEYEGRHCNGTFFWKIKNYSHFRREAESGDTTAIHSPPFYSSFYGYKMCLRVNLNGVDSAKGTHLSVFVHFMQGEFDDLLAWPFSGSIRLMVIDQNDVWELRHHVIEHLSAKPNLAAFQRPQTPRNHKGFGYMEFFPLALLDSSTYIKNDTLVIKAVVSNTSMTHT